MIRDTELRFRCTQCGDCCRQHRVPLTDSDLRRLVNGTGLDPVDIVEWLAPEDIDMTGEPESFVELPEGRRLMTLGFDREACRFLDTDGRCSVYSSRPTSCRTFPFEPTVVEGKLRRLELLHASACRYESDGENDPAEILAGHHRRTQELRRYAHRVQSWNKGQRRLRFLRRPTRSGFEFLELVAGSS